MAFSAHSDPEMVKEIRDPAADVSEKTATLTELLRAARRVTVFTGAGISTAAGIADYRGPQGVWTLQAKGQEDKIRSVDMMRAVPTATHMALVEMLSQGVVHHVISQNVDGLHRKSGVRPEALSELHGNSIVERCVACRREYLRDFNVQTGSGVAADGGFEHRTGRVCDAPGCGGALADTIVHFGESLPLSAIEGGFAASTASDLHIVLGSSLTVSPACQMPEATKKAAPGNKLVIVNLQRTPLDGIADLVIRAPVNDVVSEVMSALGHRIPPFKLTRVLEVTEDQAGTVCVRSLDSDGSPATHVKEWKTEEAGRTLRVTFFGHYAEPELVIPVVPEYCKRECAGAFTSVRAYEYDPLQGGAAWDEVSSRVVKNKDGAPAPRPQGTGVVVPALAPARAAAPVPVPVTSADADEEQPIMYSVLPMQNCEHCRLISHAADLALDLKAPCGTCGNVGENMICLTCHEVHCGRHVSQHMVAHNEATGHNIVCGFRDLSFWCYGCDAYVVPTNPMVLPFYVGLHTAKFGAPPPTAARVSVKSTE
eukprot:Rhum_TRINITY_DN14273_c1_g2::Rhum_TRINITY_DN14273_c1_g2_i2::g.76385::m.76385/K11416/SIRT6, SIR2L6; mono-ADP-ribosyltransferase sirtuin 6